MMGMDAIEIQAIEETVDAAFRNGRPVHVYAVGYPARCGWDFVAQRYAREAWGVVPGRASFDTQGRPVTVEIAPPARPLVGCRL